MMTAIFVIAAPTWEAWCHKRPRQWDLSEKDIWDVSDEQCNNTEKVGVPHNTGIAAAANLGRDSLGCP